GSVDVTWLVQVVDDESLDLVGNVEEFDVDDLTEGSPELRRRIYSGDHLRMAQDHVPTDRRHVARAVVHRGHQEVAPPSVASQVGGLSPKDRQSAGAQK